MTTTQQFSADVIKIDCEKEVDKITGYIRASLSSKLKRRGAVVGISGGIDSSVTLALCVKALGKNKVIALQMPEKHSMDDTQALSDMAGDRYGVEKIYEDITGMLEAVSFYDRYNKAVRSVVPKYGSGWRSKIVIPNITLNESVTFFSIIAQSPAGKIIKERLDLKVYLEIVAATNFKQRIRKMLEYYHADRLHFAVAGTPNRLEYDQGFFVKNGDGAADFKPIAHLYKTQVYQLAAFLGVPDEILSRPPTTDTYSLAQGQDEFYFSLPYDKMDICLYGKNHNIDAEIVGGVIGLKKDQVERVYKDIDQKRATTRYLHHSPLLVEDILEY